MKFSALFLLLLFCFTSKAFSQKYKVLESASDHLKIEFDFQNFYKIADTVIEGKTFQMIKGKSYPLRNPGEPWLPAFYINAGVPQGAKISVNVISDDQVKYVNKLILPMPAEDPAVKPININEFNRKIYSSNNFFPVKPVEIADDHVYRFARIIIINASPFQYNPVSRVLIFNKKITVLVKFLNLNAGIVQQGVRDIKTTDFLKRNVINPVESQNWIGQVTSSIPRKISGSGGRYWFSPSKQYIKIYTSQKGICRITCKQLINAGMSFTSIPLSKIELFNNGKEVPIYITDANKDGYFNLPDYFEFVSYPAAATPYAYSNIYNRDNVYFFSEQADSAGLRYKIKDGLPQKWDATYQTNFTTLHFERDSLFENLGYAGDDKRDFWLWDKVLGNNGAPVHTFSGSFNTLPDINPDSTNITVKVRMQGLSTSAACDDDHNAYISLTGQSIGNIMWDGQTEATFEKTISISSNGIKLYPANNILGVKVTGDACPATNSDVVDVNWFEIQYWRDNRADTNHIEFSSPPNKTGVIRYWTWNWQRDSILVFIPQNGYLIKDASVLKDQYNSGLFVDTVTSSTDYFCAGYDYYLSPDSLIKAESSDLRNTGNGADYIIITHPDFKSVAEKLAAFRQNNFPDSTIPDPRIKVVYVNQIYNEFSNGLLDPYALRDFVKYAFNNWQKPAPSYVVLLGDMSHDYRHLLSTSRPSFVPSIPYFTYDYGEGVSDNEIVCMNDSSVHPDLAIGRLSCETVAEGNVLVDKLINYPADNSKQWKQNVLLISAGLSTDDETVLNLNEASMELAQDYVDPTGISSTKIMRYPNKPEYMQYQGDGPAIRNQIDNGTVLLNYYGHGGGYQWDLVFLNDDIYQLNNGGRLPLILSLTCYTAHFDDQNVFGEQFNKVAGKGSIGFFGNVGLTYWVVGKYFDDLIFTDIFKKRNYLFGKVVLDVKNQLPEYGNNISQIALLTYLGDPVLRIALPDKPDFSLGPGDITTGSPSAVVNDNVSVQVKVHNYGVVFPGDSVTVQLKAESSDTSYIIGTKKLGNFAHEDSLFFNWAPNKNGLYTLTANVNLINVIPEMDPGDNSASASLPVYNLNEPSIVSPIDGYTTNKDSVVFKIADIGSYLMNPLTYFVQVDTVETFNSPMESPALKQQDGVVRWALKKAKKGIYYWRTRIFDGTDSSRWSAIRTFSIGSSIQHGYYAAGKQLSLYTNSNLISTDSGLVINTNYLPPKPSDKTFIEDWRLASTVFDSVGMTALTTDGIYIYFGYISYYAARNNPSGNSNIFKIGTGNYGTEKGKYYGTVPNFYSPIKNTMFYYKGYIYVATGNAHSLFRVNPNTGDTGSVYINAGLINDGARVENGTFYVNADSQYVYDLALKDASGNDTYTLRILNPGNGWSQVKPDIKLSGSSYGSGFASFYVVGGYLFAYENYTSGFMRRIRISDGFFEEEWLTRGQFQGYYGWTYDWLNNKVYASVFRDNVVNYPPKISVFNGKYLDANGTSLTLPIGPALSWSKVSYNVKIPQQTSKCKVVLLGENNKTKNWDTLAVNIPYAYDLKFINPKLYDYIRLGFNLSDSTTNISNPLMLKSVAVNYQLLPEIAIDNAQFIIDPDTVIKKLPLNISLKVRNLGDVSADSISLNLYLNNASDKFFNKNFSLLPDSSANISTSISTEDLSGQNKIKAVAALNSQELYTFNNQLVKNFTVIRDTAIPNVSVTFDGKEIISGDIVASKPKINIMMTINSKLPIDTSAFIVLLDNEPVSLSDPTLKFTTFNSPKNGINLDLNPSLKDGTHSLDVLLKNPDGNFTDSLSSKVSFVTYSDMGLRNVYNYPNPFRSETFFTFQMTGQTIPDEMYIKIYTVAGRLIKTIHVPVSDLTMGFDKIQWDGRDADGDLIANGVYFYKIVYKNGGVTKSYTQKLAIVR